MINGSLERYNIMPANNIKKKLPPKHPLSWFINRIGKTIYRKDTGNIGVLVKHKIHANALEMYQNDLDLYYQDKPFTE